MTNLKKSFRGSLYLAAIVTLASCGGSGGDPVQEVVNKPTASIESVTSPSFFTEYTSFGGAVEVLHRNEAVTVSGTSSNATSIQVSVAGGGSVTATGTDEWTAELPAGMLSVGENTLTVTVSSGNDSATDTTTATVAPTDFMSISSSVDGAVLPHVVFEPENLGASGADVPLVIYLHGGGGRGRFHPAFLSQLTERGWMGLAPDGRDWNLDSLGCPINPSWAYIDAHKDGEVNPDVGPGEQDILDSIQWVIDNYPVDTDRIYIAGHSMGGRGALSIGLKNPDMFAAVGGSGAPSDMYENFIRNSAPGTCKFNIPGGAPGTNPEVDTNYAIGSFRFLLENAYNVPTMVQHSAEDTFSPNNRENPPSTQFLSSWMVTVDNSWEAGDVCPVTDPQLVCFGHTPTLSELDTAFPGGYDWAYHFAPNSTGSFGGHGELPEFWDGATVAEYEALSTVPGQFQGTVNPDDPTRILGFMDFFATKTLEHSPETVVYKTYTSQHTKAYWTNLVSATPWLNQPAGIRATRSGNSVAIELSRAAEVGIDLALAEINPSSPITLTVSELSEDVFDPNLEMGASETLETSFVLSGDLSAMTNATVTVNGVEIDAPLVTLDSAQVSFGPVSIAATTTIVVTLN